MEIKQIPPNYASLRSPLIYTFSDTAARTFNVQIIDANADEVLGIKRLTGVAHGSIDVAPFLRRNLFFFPKTGSTGFVSAGGRAATAAIKIDSVRSQTRTFVPAFESVVPPVLLTTSLSVRMIGRGECEELTLCTVTPCVVRVTAFRGAGTDQTVHTAPYAGFILFRLNTADFPDADVIRLHIDDIGQIDYHFTGFSAGRRLAWRSSAGSVEHYTFPVEKEVVDQVDKEEMLTQHGYHPVTIRSERHTTLLSAYEPEKVLNGLSEILSSPAVWSIEKGIYIPVAVDSAASGFRRHGTLRNIEVQIRHQPKTQLP